MKKFIPILSFALLLFACNQEEGLLNPGYESSPSTASFNYPEIDIQALNDRSPLKGQEIYQLAKRMGGGHISDFVWSMADDYMLWSAVVAEDSTIILGYKPADAGEIWSDTKDLNLSENRWQEARAYTIGFILYELNRLHPERPHTEENLNIEQPEGLPLMWLTLSDYEVIAKLRQLETVRYVEPDGFEPEQFDPNNAPRLIVGCQGNNDYVDDDYYSPFSSTYSNSFVSWHLTAHKFPLAWANSAGDNVTIGLLDTGISYDQDLLEYPKFTYGPSSGRFIHSTYEYTGSFGTQSDSDDRCGHGTNRAGALVGPVNIRGAITGGAYQANLRSVRVSNDVLINTSKTRKAFVRGLNSLANQGDVKVINICVGRLNDKSDVRDAVNAATGGTKQKLLVCAAGTSTALNPNAVYPARYTNTIAVTGVNYRKNSDPNGTSLQIEGSNYGGSSVNFCAYTQDTETSNSDFYALGMQLDDYDPRRSKGTSSAAPTISSIAALVWAANPSLTKYQVVQILNNAGSYSYKHGTFGYGVVDANDAVNQAINFGQPQLSVSISGQGYIFNSGYYTWTPQASNVSGAINSYKWYWDGNLVSTSANYSRYLSADGMFNTHSLKLVITTTSGQSDDQTMTINVI